MGELAVVIAAKVASGAIVPIGRYIVRPIARLCLFENLWEYKNNLRNLNTKLDNLTAQRDRVQGFTNVGEEPDMKNWLDDATKIIGQVSELISKNNPERGCCEGCTYSNLKESYQHRNDVARKLKDVTQLLQEALKSMSLWEYKSNLANLKEEKEKLKARRDRVLLLIKPGEEPLPDVKLWQDKVNSIINEVSGLTSQHDHQQQNNVARMLKDVAQLLQEFSEFGEVLSFRPIPEETWLKSSGGYEVFESRTSILKQIVEALSKPDVNLVGIYGMGGIGKTTLAKQVARQTIQDKVFNKIVFVEVSQTPNIKKIQGEIGSKLGLKFHGEDELSERARQLYQQLKNEEKTLLILDNIWESLDFETMGIPYKHDRKGLKLLITARKTDILIDGTEYSQHNFSIEALEWKDAWSLFKSKAGTCVDRHDLRPIAVDVAKACGGVPIAIVTIASRSSIWDIHKWKNVSRELRNPSPDNYDGIAAKVYRSIELSYNHLETDELKATFLLCSSMGSTYDASIEDLLRYKIGLGLFNTSNTMEEEWDDVCSLVSTLKASSLLVDAPKSGEVFFPFIERFAMHDIVRDVARSIAHKDKNVFNVINDVIPRSWRSENMLRNCTSITLDNVNEVLKDLQLVCPELKFLYVKPQSFGTKIPDKFFAWMPKLQVLHLICMDLQPLSTPFSDLTNLQTLCLEACMLKDKADIGDLKNLEILSVRLCSGLPEKLHQLTKLRLLELDSSGLSSSPSKFILSFKKLEALYMRRTPIEWEAEKSNDGSRNTGRDVLEHLSNLTCLEICVPEAVMLRGLLSPKLERYNITIGETSLRSSPYRWSESDWDIRCTTSRFLQVKLKTNEDGIISGLKAIRQLVLDEVPGIANNFCGLDRVGFPELEDLKVQNNSHILHIIDTVSREDVFPVLKSLILQNLINLKTICNGPLGIELFHRLRTIKVGECNELTNIFSLASDRVLQELEEIEVVDCENMEEIFAISDQVHEIKLSKLCILRLISLPQLESLCGNVKTTTQILQLTTDTKPREIILEEEQDILKPLFNKKVVVTNLETLEIKNINVNSIWDNQLPKMASFSNLTCLIISNLANLRRLGSGDYFNFPLLREVTIQNCPKFKEVFFDDKVGVPSLEKIKIFKMDNLKMIWHNQLVEDSFPKLKSLQVEECPKLLTLFRSNMCGRFLSLETLDVSICHSLEEIFDLQGVNSEESHPTTSTQSAELCTDRSLVLSFANLQNLKVKKCRSLKTIVAKEEVEAKEAPRTARFVFPKLTSLVLYELPEFRTFYLGRYTTEWPVLKKWTMYQHRIPMSELILHRGHDLLSFSSNEDGFEFEVQKIWPSLLSIMSSWVQNLTMLILHGCGDLEELFPYSMAVTEELREKKTENTMVFPKLKYLEMKQLANLKGLCSRCHIEFPILKEFQISDCPELTAFIFDDKVKVPNLKKVKISSMDKLTKIWDKQLIRNSIPKLESLQAYRCQKLLTLLPFDMCESFSSLEILNVSDCGSLEKIFDLHEINSEERHSTTSTQFKELYPTVPSFANLQNLEVSKCGSLKSLFSVLNVAKNRGATEETHAITRFVFPKLISLKLDNLLELRTFYPARYTMDWPVLRRLWLCDCGMFDTDDEDQMQNSLSLAKKAFPCLEELTLTGKELMMMWQGQDPEPLFRNFKILRVHDERTAGYVLHVDKPVLQYMGNVKYMWKQNFKLDLTFPNFEEIVVKCDSFISLMPPSASFQNLSSLEVYHCNSLEHIGTFSMAKNLVKLVSLRIHGCKKIVEVLRNHGDVSGDKILFSNLKCLILDNLRSLTSFCSSNFTLEFPSLEELEVDNCPNMKIFCLGELTTPKLHEVEGSRQSIELSPDVDVNTAIQQLHEQEQNGSDYSTDESEKD